MITDEIFNQVDTNFNFAFEIHRINKLGGKHKIDYSGYLELSLFMEHLRPGSLKPTRIPVKTHKCSSQEYEANFYPAKRGQDYIEKWFDGDLICLD